MGGDAHLLQLLLDLQGRGGLAGAGGAGQQDDVGLAAVVGDLLGRGLHLFVEGGVALVHKGLGIAADGFVQLLQRVCHEKRSFQRSRFL